MYMYVSLSQLADAMELMLLSVLSPAVECEWGLTRAEEATITSVSLHAHVLHMYACACTSLDMHKQDV